ncbi:FMN-dependent NADH-azoreductase [Teredinibacter purpureus]|uniref:FMN-dependent NADH-azoreductase n=1 Tax=Teredinibacter purpureus TaxID=2731756 RepID=UPI0005F823A6|nr:NAD(P)H-dependent oxidoreductase [Teredinibacter purpureus]
MSTHVLTIDSSIFSEAGVSHQLGQRLMTLLAEELDDLTVTHRDIASDPIPHLDASTLGAIGEGKAVLADTLIAEFSAADILILGVPMYNFGVPSVLKAWFDHITRAGTTFEYTENGPVGLAGKKKVFVLMTRGGQYQGTEADSLTRFMKTLLGFLGLNDVEFIYAEGLNMSGGVRETAIAKAEETIKAHVDALVSEQEVV